MSSRGFRAAACLKNASLKSSPVQSVPHVTTDTSLFFVIQADARNVASSGLVFWGSTKNTLSVRSGAWVLSVDDCVGIVVGHMLLRERKCEFGSE